MFDRILLFYLRFRHRVSPILFLGAFFLDLLLVKEPDSVETLSFISIHFLVTFTLILLSSRAGNADMKEDGTAKWSPTRKLILEILLQFSFGALASSLFVLYARGADLVAALPFLFLLLLFLFGNEFAHKHTSRLEVRFFSSIFLWYAFLLYIVPLVRGKLGNLSLLISSLVVFVFGIGFIFTLRSIAPVLFARTKQMLVSSLLFILCLVPVSTYIGFIPPLPLMMREGTIAHTIQKEDGVQYRLTVEKQALHKRLGLPFFLPTYHVNEGDALHFFTSIYAPLDMRVRVVHIWEKFDERKGAYVERFRIPLEVGGGRKRGYRTYSTIERIEEGTWRVSAEIKTGQVLGHRNFIVRYEKGVLGQQIK